MDIVRIFSKLGYTNIGKIYIDGTRLKGNASAKRTKDRAGFEKWLSEIEDEIAKILKEGEAIDNQEDESCKIDPEQEALKERLSDRKYLKSKIEEALEMMEEEESNTQEKVKEVAADCGYGSYANYEYLEQTCPHENGERNRWICARQ